MAEASFKIQVLEAMSTLIIGAFALVAALAWNEAIKAIIAKVFGPADEILGMVVYALIVTVLAVTMTIIITRAIKKAKAVEGIE